MRYQLGNRDANGVLTGRIATGAWTFPIEIDSSVVPFLYPCSECRQATFHVLAHQHAGLCVLIPVIRRPLFSTGATHLAICNSCASTNSTVPADVASKLKRRIIPARVCGIYSSTLMHVLHNIETKKRRCTSRKQFGKSRCFQMPTNSGP